MAHRIEVVTAVAPHQRVVSGQGLRLQTVIATTPIEQVRSLVVAQGVVAGTAIQRVIAKATIKRVLAGLSIEQVGTRLASDRVVTRTARNRIVSIAAHQRVLIDRAEDHLARYAQTSRRMTRVEIGRGQRRGRDILQSSDGDQALGRATAIRIKLQQRVRPRLHQLQVSGRKRVRPVITYGRVLQQVLDVQHIAGIARSKVRNQRRLRIHPLGQLLPTVRLRGLLRRELDRAQQQGLVLVGRQHKAVAPRSSRHLQVQHPRTTQRVIPRATHQQGLGYRVGVIRAPLAFRHAQQVIALIPIEHNIDLAIPAIGISRRGQCVVARPSVQCVAFTRYVRLTDLAKLPAGIVDVQCVGAATSIERCGLDAAGRQGVIAFIPIQHRKRKRVGAQIVVPVAAGEGRLPLLDIARSAVRINLPLGRQGVGVCATRQTQCFAHRIEVVTAVAAHQRVVSGQRLRKQKIGAIAAIEQVRALVVAQGVVARTAIQRVIAKAAVQRVIARSAIDPVVVSSGIDHIIAAQGVNDVGFTTTRERVVVVRAGHRAEGRGVVREINRDRLNSSLAHFKGGVSPC